MSTLHPHSTFDASSLSELLTQLERQQTPLSMTKIHELLAGLSLCEKNIWDLAHFDDSRYCRRRLFRSNTCEVLVIGWGNGQRSLIHDHHNSYCGVKILHGTATETTFQLASNEQIYAVHSAHYAEGEILVGEGEDIHQISNLQPADKQLITLHLYSPPLTQCHLYHLSGQPRERAFLDEQQWCYEI